MKLFYISLWTTYRIRKPNEHTETGDKLLKESIVATLSSIDFTNSHHNDIVIEIFGLAVAFVSFIDHKY